MGGDRQPEHTSAVIRNAEKTIPATAAAPGALSGLPA